MPVVVVVAAFFGFAGVANAATYFVEQGGADVDDCTNSASPCATIQYAIEQHRTGPPEPDDVIDVGPGAFAQNVDATDPLDDGLTIRGTLSGGAPATTISGDGTGIACGAFPCVVGLGSDAASTNVTLQNVEVDQTSLTPSVPPAPNPSPILLEGGSDLDTVGSTVSLDDTFAAVELCNVPGSDIVNSFLDATGTDAAGVDGCAEIDITDTGIFTGDGPALNTPGTPGETSVITRSWLSAADDSPAVTASVGGDLTVDSSLVTGAATALLTPSVDPADVLVNNSTIDALDPGLDDGVAWFIDRTGADAIDATTDSSILVDRISVDIPGGGATVDLTCEYSNFQTTEFPSDGGFTNDCPDGTDPGSTNTFENPDDLFLEDPGFDFWQLQSDAEAIDAGQPGPIPSGLSPTDFALEPRLVPGTTATCPDGVRDQGAFEAPAVSCGPPPPPPPPANRTLTVSTTGTGSGTVTGPGINCGTGGSDCTETVPDGTSIELTATAADGSAFEGYVGGGCSSNPCTVTMDANKAVQAGFRDTRSGTRTLTVDVSGAGGGVITGPGINCGTKEGQTDCSQSYAAGEEVALTADPDKDSILGRFTGSGCDASPCTVTMDITRSVVGRFDNARIPNTTFARRPTKAERNPVFRMRSSQPRSTFECKVDKGEWEACERRVVLRGLDPGRHRFKVRAINKFDVTGPPRKARFRVKR